MSETLNGSVLTTKTLDSTVGDGYAFNQRIDLLSQPQVQVFQGSNCDSRQQGATDIQSNINQRSITMENLFNRSRQNILYTDLLGRDQGDGHISCLYMDPD